MKRSLVLLTVMLLAACGHSKAISPTATPLATVVLPSLTSPLIPQRSPTVDAECAAGKADPLRLCLPSGVEIRPGHIVAADPHLRCDETGECVYINMEGLKGAPNLTISAPHGRVSFVYSQMGRSSVFVGQFPGIGYIHDLDSAKKALPEGFKGSYKTVDHSWDAWVVRDDTMETLFIFDPCPGYDGSLVAVMLVTLPEGLGAAEDFYDPGCGD